MFRRYAVTNARFTYLVGRALVAGRGDGDVAAVHEGGAAVGRDLHDAAIPGVGGVIELGVDPLPERQAGAGRAAARCRSR